MTRQDDIGTMQTMLDRLQHQRLPYALELKARVEQGDVLSDTDMEFLQRVFDEAQGSRALLPRHPETHALVGKIIGLYSAITARALENEKQRRPLR